MGVVRTLRLKAERLRRRYFPERQLYFRANGDVRFISFSPRAQMVGLGACVCVLSWMVVASVTFFNGDASVQEKERRLKEMAQDYAKLDAEMQRLQRDVVSAARRLTERQDYLNSLLEKPTSDVPSIELPIPSPEQATQRSDLQSFFFRLTGDGWRAVADIDNLSANFETLDEQQRTIAAKLLSATDSSIAAVDKVLRKAGVDKNKLLSLADEAALSGVGGPYIPLDSMDLLDESDPFNQLLRSQSELERLQTILANAPLQPPLDNYRVSSHYGGRLDPFRGSWARHSGVDFTTLDTKTPIAIRSGGVVRTAGWNGAYGRFVEVDHGNGFVTRYGHLRKIMVKKGDTLKTGDSIGLIGSSGRSTGTHLHYEIWFDGKPLNPMKFIKAAKDAVVLARADVSAP